MTKLRRSTEKDTPPFPDSNDDHKRMKTDRGMPPSTPRWVKVFGIIGIVLVLLFVILHLTGRGFGGHTPSIEHGLKQP
jgi:hypothetical protein